MSGLEIIGIIFMVVAFEILIGLIGYSLFSNEEDLASLGMIIMYPFANVIIISYLIFCVMNGGWK